MTLQVSVTEHKTNGVLVTLRGRLDSQTTSECEKAIQGAVSENVRWMTFDFESLNYLSSMGIRLIFIYRKLMEKREGLVFLTNVQPQIQKVIDIANALPSWSIFSSIAEADAYFDQMQKKADADHHCS